MDSKDSLLKYLKAVRCFLQRMYDADTVSDRLMIAAEYKMISMKLEDLLNSFVESTDRQEIKQSLDYFDRKLLDLEATANASSDTSGLPQA